VGIGSDGQLEYRCQGRAGVFDIRINAPGQDRLMTDVSAGKIEAALDRIGDVLLQALCQEFTNHQLFGEILCAQ